MTTTRLSPKLANTAATPGTIKSKRVRTGCLTCRERHLKCDESLPDCINCRKGSRSCKRGIRLNFLETHKQVYAPSHTPRSHSWAVEFQDESRHIASEYRGGLERYAAMEKSLESRRRAKTQAEGHHQPPYQCLPLPPSPLEVQAHLAHKDSLELKYSRAMSSPSSMAKSYPESRLSSPNQVRTVGWTESTEDSNYIIFPNAAPYPQYLHWQYDDSPQVDKSASLAKKVGDSPGSCFTAVALKEAREGMLRPTRYIMVRDARPGFKHPERGGRDGGVASSSPPPLMSKPATGEREFLRTADEVCYMQVFVEHVAVWMDSFDSQKHFSHFIPYRALKSPMLLNALLACGVRHLSMQDADKIHTAQFYYNTATTQLLRNLENPERDTTECAAAAVILKVCERMSRKTCRRMSHVAGARILMIRDCGWDANSTGFGLACFWLNIYLEVLSSLESDCAVSLPPNEWGLNLDWIDDDEHGDDNGAQDDDACAGEEEEEIWIQRMIYILARVADFQTFAAMFGGSELSGEKMRLEYRLPEWRNLKHLCDKWNDKCPRTMHPLGYLSRGQTASTSLFPKVWLPKREAVLGRLLYHTAQCILTQTNPMEQAIVSEEMRALQIHHAHEVCGIVAHAEERGGAGGAGRGGLAFLTVRSLIIASKALVDHGEQTEVLHILRRMHDETGCILDDVEGELRASWGWRDGHHISEGPAPFRFKTEEGVQQQDTMMEHGHQHHSAARHVAGGLMGMPMSLLHDASFAKHPYQGWYEPPSQATSLYSYH